MKLLYAEDEADMAEAVTDVLSCHKFIVDAVADGAEALEYALSGDYDGIILDLMLPRKSGLEVLRELREAGIAAPVLLLTAKSQVEDRIEGLDAGADDYLPKPFAMAELLARVRALVRRRERLTARVTTFQDLSLDADAYTLFCGQNSVRLVRREFQMMEMLMENPRHIIPTAQFMERVWGWDAEVDVSIVWVYISNLRKKLAKLGASVEIRATRGVGYSLEATV